MGSTGEIGKGLGLLNRITDQLSRSSKKLSSGSRITAASDDPAGLAIAESLKSDQVTLRTGSRNANDGISLSQIREGAFDSLSNISGRLSELAQQSANGTLSDTQRGALQEEFSQLTQEAQRIVGSTQFNGQNVFNGSTTSIQVGVDASEDSRINLKDPGLTGTVAALTPLNISSQDNAQTALDSISTFTSSISQTRGELGAQQARLQVANNNNQVQSENLAAAESRIRDLDYASEVANNTALQIQQQASVAISAQANQNASVVRKLLGA